MSEAVRTAMASIFASIGWRPEIDDLELRGGPSVIATDFPVSDLAAAAFGALSSAAAELHGRRGAARPRPFVDRTWAGTAMTANDYLRIGGAAPDKWGTITGYFRCGDGGHVYLHGQFPHLRQGLLELFGAEDDRESMAAAFSRWTADDAEREGQERGLCVLKLRTRDEWEAHPQAEALAQMNVIEARAADAASRPLAVGGDAPLSNIRVLDLSRVIAGPMAGRALAELGANVMRISAPDLPSLEPLVIDTGFGKRASFCDLSTKTGRDALRALVAEADILIDGFRPGALAGKGFSPAALAEINPALTYVSLSAFSDVGPWAGRRGYDSYVQSGVGLAAPAVRGDDPIRLPCQPLDYLSGALMAFGAVVSLIRRTEGGGPLSIEMSLARTAIWLWEMTDEIGRDANPPEANATFAEAKAAGMIRGLDTDFGPVEALAPAYGFDGVFAPWSGPSRRLGSSPPHWIS